jgi:transcriptional regulator with XRE-family HTH domain
MKFQAGQAGSVERAKRWKKAGLTPAAIRAREKLIADDEARGKPSRLFARNLRVVRESRGLSQRQVAERMTDAGHPMTKVAVTRLEADALARKLTLDEALAFAWVLDTPLAHLLSPPDGSHVFPTAAVGLSGPAVRQWLLFGDPFDVKPERGRVRARLQVLSRVERLAQLLIDVRRQKNKFAENDVLVRLADVLAEHADEISKLR